MDFRIYLGNRRDLLNIHTGISDFVNQIYGNLDVLCDFSEGLSRFNGTNLPKISPFESQGRTPAATARPTLM
jgi:hypothetical protein